MYTSIASRHLDNKTSRAPGLRNSLIGQRGGQSGVEPHEFGSLLVTPPITQPARELDQEPEHCALRVLARVARDERDNAQADLAAQRMRVEDETAHERGLRCTRVVLRPAGAKRAASRYETFAKSGIVARS